MQQLPSSIRGKIGLIVAGIFVLGAALTVGAYVYGTSPADPAADDALPAQPDDGGADLPPADALDASTPAPRRPEATPRPETAVVYVSGAVRRPDVYVLPAAARVKDAVLAAGGFADDADPNRINLAGHISDADQIQVPRQGETLPAVAAPSADAPASDAGAPLNINTASASDLEGLDGIGQALAERIVAYREANGPFQKVEDLQKVKGIGAGLVDKLAPQITIAP